MSTFIVVFVFIIIFMVLLLSVVGLYFYKIAIYRQPKEFLADSPDLAVSSIEEVTTKQVDWIDAQTFEDVEIKSYDGLLLHGYYLAAPLQTGRTAMLAHGYSGESKSNMGSIAQVYVEKFGYNVLLADARGHGRSEGNYIGFGWHERLDYLKWISYLIQKNGPTAQLVLHGISMGGSTVLMTSGEPLPQQVKCIMSDCAYTSARDILTYQLKRMYHLPPFPLVPLTSLVCKLRAGYFFGEASALKQVQKAQVPILFIHGDEDTFVPTAMVDELYAACVSEKELVVISGAGHGLAYTINPVSYIQKMELFLQRYVH